MEVLNHEKNITIAHNNLNDVPKNYTNFEYLERQAWLF